MFSSKLLASIYLAVVCASGALAAPWTPEVKLATHRTRELKDGFKLEAYHPVSTYETFGEKGIEHSLSKRADASIEDSARAFVESHTGISSDSVNYKGGFSAETARHAYLKQTINGVTVANAVANVAFNHDNNVVAFGSSFVKPKKVSSAKAKISTAQAIKAAEGFLDGKYNDHEITQEYVITEDNSAVLTHVVQVQNAETNGWWEAFINAETGELVTVTDFVADATFRAVPITSEYPTSGFQTFTDPEDTTASPYGWLSTTGTTQSTTTSGNNAVAYIGSSSTGTASQSASGQFVYTYTTGGTATTTANKNGAIVNAFYVVNSIHDITYRYGFTEAAYNFQTTNIKSGGKGNDRVLISVQDSSGTNNANFATPADGSSGQMRMFLWTTTSPGRDGAVENDIVSHEMTHGVTNRMTGGGTGRCLQTTEAGGMGEGWSDAMANWLEKTSSAVPDFKLGEYVYGKNIRNYPYSTSATTNPLRYSSIKSLNEVHNIGEVWANMLHNVYAALVSAHGWSDTARTDPTSTAGNAVFLHLFLDALQLQPCSPTFVTARDAWIQADANRYAGANKCTIWKAFASRGLGVNAKSYTDDSSVPSGC